MSGKKNTTWKTNQLAKIKLANPELSDEEVEEYLSDKMAEIGARGGSRKSPTKGFGHEDADPSASGKKGGSISRRRKATL
jgi:general stress protein YciG